MEALSSNNSGCLTTLYEGYASVTTTVVKTIFCNTRCADYLLEFLLEPISFLKTVYHYLRGRVSVENFTLHRLNPTEVKADQVAVLLIHGAACNQGSWISLAERVEKETMANFFTIDLNGDAWPWSYDNSMTAFSRDAEKVGKRIDEIKAQYTDCGFDPPKIVVVGHSHGGILGQFAAPRDDVDLVITLGGPCPSPMEKVLDITGDFDHLVPERSESPQGRVKSTHMGLLYNDDIHDIILQQIAACKLGTTAG